MSKEEEKKDAPDVLDNIENKIGKVDKILSSLKVIFKKHWGTIILLALCGFIYWAFTLPPVEPDPVDAPEQAVEQIDSSAYWAYWDSVYIEDSLRNLNNN